MHRAGNEYRRMFQRWKHIARRPVLSRRLILAVSLPVLVLVYVGFVLGFGDDLASGEQQFAAASADAAGGSLDVYVSVVGIDPANEAAHLRLYLTRRGAPANAPAPKLQIDDGYGVQELTAPVAGQAPPTAIEITMDGSRAGFYPLERFRARLGLRAEDGTVRVPIRLTMWDGIVGWRLRTVEQPTGPGDAGAVHIQLGLRRNAALAFLALAIYGTMVLIGVAALTVGILVFLRVRKLEATMAGFLSGLLFALPAMRYGLPGSPPFGVLADQLAFLWAELAAALGLLLWVFSWATHGPRD